MILLALHLVGLLAPPSTPTSLQASTPQDDSARDDQTQSSELRSAAQLEADGWVIVDAVIAQAGDGIITRSDLDDFLRNRLGPGVSMQEVQEMVPRALQTMETLELETQAGEEMGIPREEIERNVQSQLDERRRTEGVNAVLDHLGSRGLDARTAIPTQVRELYSVLWRRDQVGEPGAAGRRITQDTFLRPGTLRAFYRENRDTLGDPPRVRFQRIAIACGDSSPEAVESARLEALDVIQRINEGESFQDLLLEIGAEDPVNSLEDWQSIPALRAVSQSLEAFASRAPERSIFSEPMPAFPATDQPGVQPKQVAWFIYQLNNRVAGAPPLFESRQTQEELRELLSSRWKGAILSRAREDLATTSYRWRHWIFGGGPELEVAGPPAPER